MRFLPIFLLLIGQCWAANILFMVYHDKGSHFHSMLPMMEKLASRGHSVTVLDTIFPKDQHPSVRHVRAQLPIFPYDNELLELMNSDFDLLVLDDIFWSFGYAFATLKHRLWEQNGMVGPEPRIVVYATAGTSLRAHNSIRAMGRNWLGRTPMTFYVPTDENDAFTADKFLHRIYAFCETVSEFFFINFIVERFLLSNIAKFGVPNFTWHEYLSIAHLFLHEHIDLLGHPMTTVPESVTVGAHCKNPKSLSTIPAKFWNFMEDPGSKGTVYIAFGTHVDWKYAPKRILDAFSGAIRQLHDFRVILVCKECKLADDLGQNVMITHWVPQIEVLAHPSIKAFVTHGGFKSLREGICAGTPLIVMPILAEQNHNAHFLMKTGIAAAVINKFSVTGSSLFSTIKNVVSRSEFRERAKRHREIFLDRPFPSMDEGIYAVERLIRDEKPSRKRAWIQRKGMAQGWTEYAYLDMALALTFVMIFIGK